MMLVARRRLLLTGAGFVLLPGASARATPVQVADLIKAFVGDGTLQTGRVKLDLPLLVENGNAVSMSVSAEGPLTGPARVERISVFAEANPLPNVADFVFGPRSGGARVSTRIRLATSQTVIAVAKCADGSCWSDSVELLVTLAACLD
jgi:sulfur-oxidizing protein SoxY